MSRTRILGNSGINWNWYLCADFDEKEKTAFIRYHARWHKYEDANHPEAEWLKGWNPWELMEDKERTVYGVRVEKVEYLVTNPKLIWDYKELQ